MGIKFVEVEVVRARNAQKPIPQDVTKYERRKYEPMNIEKLNAELVRCQEQYDQWMNPGSATLIAYLKMLIEQKSK